MSASPQPSSNLVILTDRRQTVLAADMAADLAQTIADSKSAATRRAYKHDWESFERWCAKENLPALPAPGEVVAAYCDARARAGAAYAYICRGLTAIGWAHEALGMPNPRKSIEVNFAMQGIRKRIGVKQRQVDPLLIQHLRLLINTPASPPARAARNKALILTGFLAALRRSELATIRFEDLVFCDRGMVVHLPKSKTDQEMRGADRMVPFCLVETDLCAVRAMKAWLEVSGITEGWVFQGMTSGTGKLTGHPLAGGDVALIIKAACRKNGLDPDKYAGHSLRAGLATQAVIEGVGSRSIMKQTGHKNRAMLDRYVRLADRWRDNVVTEMGL